MSDQSENESVGTVQVKVSPAQVHKAVRNLLANELKLDPIQIMDEVRANAERLIQEKVVAYLDGHGYSAANLENRVIRCLQALEPKFEELLRKAIEVRVHDYLERELRASIEAIIGKTEFKVGWNKTTVKVTVAEEGK